MNHGLPEVDTGESPTRPAHADTTTKKPGVPALLGTKPRAQSDEVSTTALAAGAARVLVVDDDAKICRRMAAGLAQAGFQVVTAHDVDGALLQISNTPPDVAIVDLGMPSGSGLDVIRQLKQLHNEAVHVIVLTGRDDERSRVEAFEAGSDDYVVKPIALAEIRRRVSAASRMLHAFVAVRHEKEAAERRLVYGHEATALLAHDMNNGLTIALSNLSYLIEEVQGDPEHIEALAATLRTVRRMSGLVANFVDIARFEDAAVKPVARQAPVCQLLESVIEVNAPSAKHAITFAVDCPPDLVGRFDVALVERVLHNLVGNGVRYCSRGGRIVVGGRRWHDTDDGSVEISVTNTGPPIPDEIRPQLFGKYVRGKGGKRGMGLYFCRLVAEAHGGRIEYEADADGPCFALRLPGHA